MDNVHRLFIGRAYIHMYIHTYIHVYIHTHIYICIYVYKYICIYICIHIHTQLILHRSHTQVITCVVLEVK